MAISRGLGRSNSTLVAVGLVVWGAQLLKRFASRDPDTVYLEELKVGEKLVVTHLPPEH